MLTGSRRSWISRASYPGALIGRSGLGLSSFPEACSYLSRFTSYPATHCIPARPITADSPPGTAAVC